MNPVRDPVAFWRGLAALLYFLGLLMAGLVSIETWSTVPENERGLPRRLLYIVRPLGWPLIVLGVFVWASIRRLLIDAGLMERKEK
jgi:hypothetical protein